MKRRKARNRSRAGKDKPPPVTFALSAASGLLLYAAFPPIDLSLLAWIAPAFGVYLIRRRELTGRRPYRVIWATAGVHWFLVLEGIGRAYWANYIGLVMLSAYLALYQVAFIALSRGAVHRWKMSVVLAAPIVWTGLELARGHLLSGFSMALLGHTQYRLTPMIQIADVFGAYGVSFLVMLVATCCARAAPCDGRRLSYWPALPLTAALVGTWIYGASFPLPDSGPQLKVALIQGTEDTVLEHDIERARQRAIDTFTEYWRLTEDMSRKHDDVQLIVWPESVFTATSPEIITEGKFWPPPDAELTPDEYQELIQLKAEEFAEKLRLTAATFNQFFHDDRLDSRDAYFLVGTDTAHFSGDRERTYNTALLIDPAGRLADK